MNVNIPLKMRSFVATALTAALGLGGLAAGTDALRISPATYSGTNGPILYTSYSFQNQTTTLKATTEAGVAVTHGFTATGLPQFSADATKAVWLERTNSAWAVKMSNSNGSNVVTVASGTGSNSPAYPSFSPDGTKIALSYDNDIHILDAAAGQTISASNRVIDSSGAGIFANQPQYISSTKIAFVGSQTGDSCSSSMYAGIYVKDLNVAGNGTVLTNSCNAGMNRTYATDFDVSPNGQFIVFRFNASFFSVAIMKTDNTGSKIAVYNGTGYGSEAGGKPAFSPDGTKVAFYANSKMKVASFDGATVGTASNMAFPSPTDAPDTISWSPVEANVAATTTTTTTSTTSTTVAPTTTAVATTTAAPTTTAAATTTTVANVFAAAKPGVTVTDSKVYTAPPVEVAASSAINVLTTAQAKVMDIETKTPAICLPNDDELVFLDEGKCIAEVVNAKTRAVLRVLKTTVVADDISEVKVGNAIVTLAPIYFDAMSSSLDARDMALLRSIKSKVSAAGSVLVIGHSGTLNGNSPANVAISRDRAMATVAALKSIGAKGPFALSGVGALDPASNGKTEAAQAKNRRVVIALIP